MTDSPNGSNARVAAFGLISREARWGLTIRGWLLTVALLFVCFFALLFGVHPFLAVTDPKPGGILVVEGWIPEYSVGECAKIFTADRYQKIFAVGGPVGEAGEPAEEDDTYAYIAASKLLKLNVPRNLVETAPTRVRTRDRTYSSAVALRKKLEQEHLLPSAITVATLGPHARRSRLLYQEAFGPKTKIGIIALRNREYDPAHWWRYSEGVKEVISESAAYLYARLLFAPNQSDQSTNSARGPNS